MIRAKTERPAGSKARVLSFMLAALIAASLMLDAKPAHAADITVTNTNDSGAGSLRQAIEDANASQGKDTIKFNIPGTGVKTIRPDSRLPQVTEAVTIDGYSQPGSKKNTQKAGANAVLLVELSGTGGASGLIIDADNVVVRGLVINRFSQTHIDVRGSNNRIEGNFIGPDATGTIDVGGGDDGGVSVTSGSGNVIGGALPGARNLISGNDRAGIILFGGISGASDNRVEGNLIGTKKDGTSPLGNGTGVSIFRSPGNTVGGTAPGAANTIAFNEGEGVPIFGGESTGNRVLGNSIFSNGGLGIDVGDDGPTANDPGDADTGANGLQNFPVLTSAKTSKFKVTTVEGTLNSQSNTVFTIQLFSSPSGTDEGQTFIGEKRVTTDGNGNASFTFKTNRVAENVTATATDSDGNTSEFSAPKAT